MLNWSYRMSSRCWSFNRLLCVGCKSNLSSSCSSGYCGRSRDARGCQCRRCWSLDRPAVRLVRMMT